MQEIFGEKIMLKPIEEKNIPLFVAWTSDPEVNMFTTGRGFSLEEEKAWFKETVNNPNEHVFTIYLKENDTPIGNCGLHGNFVLKEPYNGKTFLGIMIGEKSQWGKGYGTDVIMTLLHHAKKDLKETEIFLSVDAANTKAIHLYEKCGFEKVERWHNEKRVTKTKEEYVMRRKL